MATPIPTPDQVHALIPQRPPFTVASRPSINEVQDLIDLVADAVMAETPGEFPAHLAGKVKYLIAYNVAAQIEASYFPEQQLGSESPSEQLYRQYQAELLGLRSLLTALNVNQSSGAVVSMSLAGPRTQFYPADPYRYVYYY